MGKSLPPSSLVFLHPHFRTPAFATRRTQEGKIGTARSLTTSSPSGFNLRAFAISSNSLAGLPANACFAGYSYSGFARLN